MGEWGSRDYLINRSFTVRNSRPKVSIEKVFLKISQISLENTSVEVSSQNSCLPQDLRRSNKGDSNTGVFL